MAEQADGRALVDLEVDVAAAPRTPRAAIRPKRITRSFSDGMLVVEPEALGDAAHLDRRAPRSELLGEVAFEPAEHRRTRAQRRRATNRDDAE